MPATIVQARDQISGITKAALDATLNGSPDFSAVLTLWDDTEGPKPGSIKTAWLRHKIKHATGGASSLGGADGVRRYSRAGNVLIEVFTAVGDGRSTSDQLVNIIMRAHERGSTANGVWFRNVRFTEVGVVKGWTQTNVLAEFEYDEVR